MWFHLFFKDLFGTAPAPVQSLLKLELRQIVSAPPKIGAELGRVLSQHQLQMWS
jgi:aspartate/tyrosine/aromatic aminotransferase